MDEGKCGAHHYENIDQAKIDASIEQLKKHGATVNGDNPWDLDTHNHGVKLRGSWDKATLTLTIIVTDKNWYVPCSKIWETIDSLIHQIEEVSVAEIEEVSYTLAAADEGKCGAHHYENINQAKIDASIEQLKKHGATVNGDNPWDVDTHNHSVKLRGSWDKATSTLTIIITDKNWYVPCSKIWETIDSLIHQIEEVSVAEIEEVSYTLAAADEGKCGAHHYENIDQAKIDASIEQLKKHGTTVNGDNPWDLDTHNHGVKLRGSWDKATLTLTIIVTDKSWYVPCSKIWGDY